MILAIVSMDTLSIEAISPTDAPMILSAPML
jgi:hypothetical protein